ncbi:MAG: D-alanine--D-alanine ligase family protein [Ktedonobacterales bacterium]
MQAKLRVGVLYGGRSSEHDVSVQSARAILEMIDNDKYSVVPIAIGRDGQWLPGVQPDDLEPIDRASVGDDGLPDRLPRSGLSWIADFHTWAAAREVDVVFPALHGPFGEDGTVQGLLELAGIPYVGSGVLGSALGMDKEKAKQIVQAAGIPVVPWVTTSRHALTTDLDAVAARVEAELDYPVFVKPVNMGSSLGVSKAQQPSDLRDALSLAARYDRRLLIETAIPCRELECGVLGNASPSASAVGEVRHHNEFFDYYTKYEDETFRFEIPAPIEEALATQIRRLALRAFEALDLSGLARVDFFLDQRSQQLYFNEVNTMPGFTHVSTYPQLWASRGIPYPQLLDRLIALALDRATA